MNHKHVLRLQNVTKKFGNFVALDTVSFSVDQGEIIGFVGANGAGKTTTISTILGFISANQGSIELFGVPIYPANAHRFHGRIGYAAGDMELPAHLTGRRYLAFVLHQARGNHDAYYKELCRLFEPQLDKKIGELSRGNKQKIALIAAFVTEPELLILDEPTSGLDPVMQSVFIQRIREFKDTGGTVFMSSHYLNEVADVCSRVILMRTGKVVQDISSQELLEKSGKAVCVTVGDKIIHPPHHATNITTDTKAGRTRITFVFKGEPPELQEWIARIKQLYDIKISEYNLEGAFHSLYESEPAV